LKKVTTENEITCSLLNYENSIIKINENSNEGLEIVIAGLCAVNKKFLMMKTSTSSKFIFKKNV